MALRPHIRVVQIHCVRFVFYQISFQRSPSSNKSSTNFFEVAVPSDSPGSMLIIFDFFYIYNSCFVPIAPTSHLPLPAQGMSKFGFATVNSKVKAAAPCSVGIYVDNGLGSSVQLMPASVAHSIAVLFFGGPDDREAIAVALRMAEHPGVKVTVFHFHPDSDVSDAITAQLSANSAGETESKARMPRNVSFRIPANKLEVDYEAERDSAALVHVRRLASGIARWERVTVTSALTSTLISTGAGNENGVELSVRYVERVTKEPFEEAVAAASEGFDLLLLGKGRRPSPLLSMALHHDRLRWLISSEAYKEETEGLGPLAAVLMNTPNLQVAMLVLQQHDPLLVRSPTGQLEEFGIVGSGVEGNMAGEINAEGGKVDTKEEEQEDVFIVQPRPPE